MTDRDRVRVQGVKPFLVEAYIKIDAAARDLGFPIFVVEGLRSQERQIVLWQQGRFTPGRVVTNCDGVTTISEHQRGRAVDFAFVDDPRTPKDETWDAAMPWALIGMMAKTLGLRWGGDWKRVDSGHLELAPGA